MQRPPATGAFALDLQGLLRERGTTGYDYTNSIRSRSYRSARGLCPSLHLGRGHSDDDGQTHSYSETDRGATRFGERAHVHSATTDLQARFGTTAQAAAAGYFRYTNEDDTGAISWVNTKYWTSDPTHPSQLWYDVNGKLIGVDYSILMANSPKAPSMWGISPSRWQTFEQHVHFGVKSAHGIVFGAVGPKGMAKVGGSLSNPTAEDVVKLGKAKSTSDVAFVFEFPAIWDLEFWLVPNPLGAFAEHNPNVIPSANAESM
jgi:hypothetical protein